MPFKTLFDYFEQDGQLEDKIIIQSNGNRSKFTTNKKMVSSDEQDDFLSLFLMPKKQKPHTSKKMGEKKDIFKHFDDNVDEKQIEVDKDDEPAVANTSKNILMVYTDGSCILNGKPNARGGWAVYFPGGEFANMAEKYTNHPTNQRCELTAIWKALQSIQPYIISGGYAQLYTDSEYSIKCLTDYCRKWSQNGWHKADKKPIENRDIIEPLYSLYRQLCGNIQIKHVRAHTGNQDKHSVANDIVDQMARQALFSN